MKLSFSSFLFCKCNQRCIKASEAKSKSICTMFLSGTIGEINWIVGFIHNWKFGKVPMQIYCAGMLKWMDFEEIFNLQFKLLWIVPHRFAGLNHITHCNYVIDSISRKGGFCIYKYICGQYIHVISFSLLTKDPVSPFTLNTNSLAKYDWPGCDIIEWKYMDEWYLQS